MRMIDRIISLPWFEIVVPEELGPRPIWMISMVEPHGVGLHTRFGTEPRSVPIGGLVFDPID